MLNTDAVAQVVIDAMDAETFLILPHPEVKEYMGRKLDRDRWLRGMRRLRDKTGEGQRKSGRHPCNRELSPPHAATENASTYRLIHRYRGRIASSFVVFKAVAP